MLKQITDAVASGKVTDAFYPKAIEGGIPDSAYRPKKRRAKRGIPNQKKVLFGGHPNLDLHSTQAAKPLVDRAMAPGASRADKTAAAERVLQSRAGITGHSPAAVERNFSGVVSGLDRHSLGVRAKVGRKLGSYRTGLGGRGRTVRSHRTR
jgi:hypothetical protein